MRLTVPRTMLLSPTFPAPAHSWYWKGAYETRAGQNFSKEQQEKSLKLSLKTRGLFRHLSHDPISLTGVTKASKKIKEKKKTKTNKQKGIKQDLEKANENKEKKHQDFQKRNTEMILGEARQKCAGSPELNQDSSLLDVLTRQ